MIEVTPEELEKTPKEIQEWFKTNLSGTTVNHSKIGEINIYNSSFGETRHHIALKFLPLLYHLKELIETANTNGKIGKDRKNHIPNCKGFIYLYNKAKVEDEILDIRLNILVDNMGKKYYMLNFVKNESHILDPKMFDKSNFSEGSNMTSSIIIHEDDKNVKTYNDNIGDTFYLGDNFIITINKILPNFEQLNKELEGFL